MYKSNVDRERSSLLAEKAHLEKSIWALKQEIQNAKHIAATTGVFANKDWWDATNAGIYEGNLRIRAIQEQLYTLSTKHPPAARQQEDASRQEKVAVLFKVAHASREFLYGDMSDDDAEDLLEDALNELNNICPGWQTYRRSSHG